MDKLIGKKIYTVSELNNEIKVILEDAYPEIWLEGEVSNAKIYSSGHLYFSLKDSDAQISAVIFGLAARHFKFKFEDGLKVVVKGRVSSYPKRGDYQIIISHAEPYGKGALQLAFEQLKAKLEKEGLFDSARKQAIPELPQKIGIVTSPTGAAVRDILSVINRRFANVEILLYPVRVQGDEAKEEISHAIEYLNAHHKDLDVLLVGRGGGSYEDLWAFNEEVVVRAIAASKIPIISCVGHEIDFTLADFAADQRAATPSAAAELVVRNKAELINRIEILKKRLINKLKSVAANYEQRLKASSNSKFLRNPIEYFEEKIQSIDEMSESLTDAIKGIVEDRSLEFANAAHKLNLLSPLGVLQRGYSICTDAKTGNIVKNIADIKADDNIKVKLSKGTITAKVEGMEG